MHGANVIIIYYLLTGCLSSVTKVLLGWKSVALVLPVLWTAPSSAQTQFDVIVLSAGDCQKKNTPASIKGID